MPTVLIVDDHLLLRQGLKHVIAQEYRGIVFGEIKTLAEIPSVLRRRPWDLVVVNLEFSTGDGFSAIAEIHRRSPDSRILVISSRLDPACMTRAIEFGVSGFVSDNADRAVYVKAVQLLLAGKTYFFDYPSSEDISSTLPHTTLSHRELEILYAIAAGKKSSQIAAELGISIQSVSTYKHRILCKMGLSSAADLVRYVIDARLPASPNPTFRPPEAS